MSNAPTDQGWPTSGALRRAFSCPVCRGSLGSRSEGDDTLLCDSCGRAYDVRDGVTILLAPTTLQGGAGTVSAHTAQQAAFFDQPPDDDFGVVRPRGAPALHRWLLAEKFRRSILGLEDVIPGATVLTVCGGSGLDAEFLHRAGARVILSDISEGVVRQAAARARRFGLDIELVVADAENLPFADRSVDIVYVHDGLHHLEHPMDAIGEMARVARRAISISEPATARATSAAVRIGWAERREEAGNLVRRLTLDEIVSELARHGFETLAPHRYAMYYRHWPGRAVRALSRPGVFPLATGSFRAVNRVAGRFGNKLAVQAVRSDG
jgi:SAM-dependent methyltransferase